jgi:hypothetical protein
MPGVGSAQTPSNRKSRVNPWIRHCREKWALSGSFIVDTGLEVDTGTVAAHAAETRITSCHSTVRDRRSVQNESSLSVAGVSEVVTISPLLRDCPHRMMGALISSWNEIVMRDIRFCVRDSMIAVARAATEVDCKSAGLPHATSTFCTCHPRLSLPTHPSALSRVLPGCSSTRGRSRRGWRPW